MDDKAFEPVAQWLLSPLGSAKKDKEELMISFVSLGLHLILSAELSFWKQHIFIGSHDDLLIFASYVYQQNDEIRRKVVNNFKSVGLKKPHMLKR